MSSFFRVLSKYFSGKDVSVNIGKLGPYTYGCSIRENFGGSLADSMFVM